jgi:hypothetical protein
MLTLPIYRVAAEKGTDKHVQRKDSVRFQNTYSHYSSDEQSPILKTDILIEKNFERKYVLAAKDAIRPFGSTLETDWCIKRYCHCTISSLG